MNGIDMASSPPAPADPEHPAPVPEAPREERIETVAGQIAAIDRLIGLAREKMQVFDIDLSRTGWNSAERADALAHFLRVTPHARLDIIVHETRWIETSCPRLVSLLRTYGHAMTIYRTGAEARGATDPLMIVDSRHYLHRYHVDQPRATLAIDMPQAARPLVTRFEEIWATGEPGLSGTVLGI
jgi:hypothetical protein